ncbi:MAG: C4-dicarboxylate transporter DcuC [Duodenibacillus sp.]|nr:C4-dicarboxylate transporter DcuC [Duodenibacillus sp.]
MSWTIWAALAIVVATVWALIKRYETRLVLIIAGLAMACLAADPLAAFRQFDKSMVNPNLIIAICSAMGFAGVISITKCDAHLVRLLTSPLKAAGIFLLPCSMVITGVVSIAIPSMAGLAASVGPTLIPILVRAGFHPAVAAGSIAAGMMPAYLNPGVSHNPFVAKLAGMDVVSYVGAHLQTTLVLSASSIVLMTLVCIAYRDYKKDAEAGAGEAKVAGNLPETPNLLYAFAPLLPVIILVCASLWAPQLKISVATAMLIGTFYAVAVTRSNPQEISKKFFNGMGKGYADIMGIIIAAGVFAAGLKVSGVVPAFVDLLKHSNEIAKVGGAVGPYLMAVMTGSGDAASFAFNEAVSPHAPEFGMTIDGLGYLAVMSGALGRMMSPLAGGVIVLCGIASVSPMDLVRRTAPAAVCLVPILYFVTH